MAVLVGELMEELLREALRAAQELLEEPSAFAPAELGRPLRGETIPEWKTATPLLRGKCSGASNSQ